MSVPLVVGASLRAIAHRFALALAATGGVLALLLPTYAVATSRSDVAGEHTTSVSLLAQMGPVAILLVLFPVAIAAVPLILSRGGHHSTQVSITTAALLVAWVLLGAWTIGVFSVPAAVCAVAAVFLRSNDRHRHAPAALRSDGAGI